MLRRTSPSDLSDSPRHGTMRRLLAVQSHPVCLVPGFRSRHSRVTHRRRGDRQRFPPFSPPERSGRQPQGPPPGWGGRRQFPGHGWGGGGRHQSVTVTGTVASVGTDSFTLTGTSSTLTSTPSTVTVNVTSKTVITAFGTRHGYFSDIVQGDVVQATGSQSSAGTIDAKKVVIPGVTDTGYVAAIGTLSFTLTGTVSTLGAASPTTVTVNVSGSTKFSQGQEDALHWPMETEGEERHLGPGGRRRSPGNGCAGRRRSSQRHVGHGLFPPRSRSPTVTVATVAGCGGSGGWNGYGNGGGRGGNGGGG